MKLEFSRQIFDKYSHTNFHEKLSSGSWGVPCGQKDRGTGRRRNMTQLIVAFRNFANEPKKELKFSKVCAVLYCKCENIAVFTVVLLRIQVFWDVLLGRAISDISKERTACVCEGHTFSFSLAQKPLQGQGLLIIGASRSHSDTAHSVGLLWTRDRPVAETNILITFMGKCYGFQIYDCDADIENSFGVWSQDHV
jgi:hypothetical protein